MTSPYRLAHFHRCGFRWARSSRRTCKNEVIELLSDRTIVRKLGARSVPLPNGNLALPRSAGGGATASYTGEGKDAKTSESKFDDVKLSAKTMIARSRCRTS